MKIGRFQAYLIVAIIGYAVGVFFYYLGKIAGSYFKDIFPKMVNILKQPQVSGILISGLIGMIFAIVLAYIWAERSYRII